MLPVKEIRQVCRSDFNKQNRDSTNKKIIRNVICFNREELEREK